jgi:hypothetical protein
MKGETCAMVGRNFSTTRDKSQELSAKFTNFPLCIFRELARKVVQCRGGYIRRTCVLKTNWCSIQVCVFSVNRRQMWYNVVGVTQTEQVFYFALGVERQFDSTFYRTSVRNIPF